MSVYVCHSIFRDFFFNLQMSYSYFRPLFMIPSHPREPKFKMANIFYHATKW